MASPTKAHRTWKETEVELLIDLISSNYIFLFDAVDNRKSKQDIEIKWRSITERINSLGVGSSPLTLKQTRRKWFDIKSKAKGVVAKFKRAQSQTGGGKNAV